MTDLMSLDDDENKPVETKRCINWGGVLDAFKETGGDVRTEAPDSTGAQLIKALDRIQEAYQSGDPDTLWKECRKQAFSNPLRALVNKKCDYACSDVLKELLLWGRHDSYEPWRYAAEMGLIKVLELFPERLNEDHLIRCAVWGKQAKTLEFLLRRRKEKPSTHFIVMELFEYHSDVDCTLLLLNETSPEEYRYIDNHGTFQEIARQACQKGSIPLLKALFDRGLPAFDFLHLRPFHLNYLLDPDNLLQPGRVDFVKFVLEHVRVSQESLDDLLHEAFQRGMHKKEPATIDVLWSHGARFALDLRKLPTASELRVELEYARSKGQELLWRTGLIEDIINRAEWNHARAILKMLQEEFAVDVQGLLQTAFTTPSEDAFGMDWSPIQRGVALKLKRSLRDTRVRASKKRRVE